jgi:hypothetical protein
MGWATLKMKEFAERIAEELGIDEPDYEDFEETAAFIDEHKQEYFSSIRGW